MKKTVSFVNSNRFSCCCAVAGTSAHKIPILDTAPILAVSICVLGVGLLRMILPMT